MREIVLQEHTAWLNYKGYCLFRRMGNRGVGIGVFLGDEHSHGLWRAWMDWRRQLLALRKGSRR